MDFTNSPMVSFFYPAPNPEPHVVVMKLLKTPIKPIKGIWGQDTIVKLLSLPLPLLKISGPFNHSNMRFQWQII